MRLLSLEVQNYRNICAARLEPGRELTVICGNNGQGKTNLLEAIWLLTGGKSFRGGKDAELVRRGEAFAVLEADTQRVVGMAPTGEIVIPRDLKAESIERARTLTFSMKKGNFTSSITWWSDPVFMGAFPKEAEGLFGEHVPSFTDDEWKIVTEPLDFYGFNIYQGLEDLDPAEKYGPYAYPGSPKTSMDWNVTPEVLYWSCRFLYERYGKPIMITENGMSCFDWVSLDGKVHDTNRIDFLHRYLRSIKDAVSEGIPVLGYQYWSIMDNFEWINGYDKRFGLVYVDYRTQKRTIKDSAYWYRDVIASNGGNL